MSYFKLKSNDLFVNTLESFPDVKFFVHTGTIYINDQNYISGSQQSPSSVVSDNILGVPRNYISLYEYNINRPTGSNDQEQRIRPFVIKNASRVNFKSIPRSVWETFGIGDQIESEYNLSSSIRRYYLSQSGDAYNVCRPSTENQTVDLYTTPDPSGLFYLRALKNTLNYYTYLSPSFSYDSITSGSQNVNLITIPDIFYGSRIKKGSVTLNYYVTGTLIAQCKDSAYNGELIGTSGSTSGSTVGVVLYKEGFILLTSSLDLGAGGLLNYETRTTSSWSRFGFGSNDVPEHPVGDFGDASYSLEFQGVTKTQTLTIFTKAPRGEVNHSNNPTYYTHTTGNLGAAYTSSYQYIENPRLLVNMVPASYTDVPPPFEKETYISKVGLYDKHRNLIGFAKLATPIRKTESREFVFKLKLDI